MDTTFDELVDVYFGGKSNRSTEEKILSCIQEFKMNISKNNKSLFVAWAFLPSGEVGYSSDVYAKDAIMRSVVMLLKKASVLSSEPAKFSRVSRG